MIADIALEFIIFKFETIIAEITVHAVQIDDVSDRRFASRAFV